MPSPVTSLNHLLGPKGERSLRQRMHTAPSPTHAKLTGRLKAGSRKRRKGRRGSKANRGMLPNIAPLQERASGKCSGFRGSAQFRWQLSDSTVATLSSFWKEKQHGPSPRNPNRSLRLSPIRSKAPGQLVRSAWWCPSPGWASPGRWRA